MTPYFEDSTVTIYHGDSREIANSLGRFDAVEMAVMFYRGEWNSIRRSTPMVDGKPRASAGFNRGAGPSHFGEMEKGEKYVYGNKRIQRSVIQVRSCHGTAEHPTQKPEGIIRPLIEYSVPPGGKFIDLLLGSGASLLAAKQLGRMAVGIEVSEKFCEIAARRISECLPIAYGGR